MSYTPVCSIDSARRFIPISLQQPFLVRVSIVCKKDKKIHLTQHDSAAG